MVQLEERIQTIESQQKQSSIENIREDKMKRLEGKVAIVTGGASGIGAATARLMAQEGASVVVADYNLDGAKEVAESIKNLDGIVSAYYVDALESESIKDLIDFTVEEYGRIDILHNNVGGTNPQKDLDVVTMDLEEWNRGFKLNIDSVMYGCRYAIPHMVKTGGGSIINTTSMSGLNGDFMRSTYGSSKAAVINLTKYVAVQYGKANIRCNAVAPGLIMTPAAEKHVPDFMKELFLKHNSLPYHGEPDDIGNTVLFLASDEAKFITGQTIEVEGGHYINNPTSPDVLAFVKKAKQA